MDSILLECPLASNPVFATHPSPNYTTMLRESIDRFLIESHTGSCDLLGFRSVFSRLIQSSPDPPLEALWFYTAVCYHDTAPSKKSAIERIAAVKDLLHLLTACSASCGGAKSVALLAPAISELYKCAGGENKKVWKEVEALAEGIVGYIGICSGKGLDERGYCSSKLLPCFLDLVRVWTTGRLGGGDGLDEFFPLVEDGIRGRLRSRGCDVEYLAGVVIAEAFLLRLCLKVRTGGALRVELQKELRIWAVSSVSVFRNCAFFEILLRMLLGPTLPVMSLLDSKDENLVRDILYDVVILVDYSFLNSGMEEEQSHDYMKNLALTRLIVTHEAIRLARAKGDHSKAISYTNAFSTSCLPHGLIKLMANQFGAERANRPNVTTPQAFLKWLVDLEEEGMRLFGDTVSELRARVIFDKVKVFSEHSALNPESRKTDADLFFIDKQGDATEESGKDEEMEPVGLAFMAAARSMTSATGNRGRKRKEWQSEGEAQVKYVKYRIHDSSIKEYKLPSVGACVSSGSEVDNPASDEEMEDMEL